MEQCSGSKSCRIRPALNWSWKSKDWNFTAVLNCKNQVGEKSRNFSKQSVLIQGPDQRRRIFGCFPWVLFTSPFSFRILLLNSLPSRQRKSSPGWMMPHLMAMARAVLMLSPVTMRTVIPARWHFRMASGTCSTKQSPWLRVKHNTRLPTQTEKCLKPKEGWDTFYRYLALEELGFRHRQGKSCIKKHKKHLLDHLPKFSPGLNKNECSAAFLTFSKPNITTQHV